MEHMSGVMQVYFGVSLSLEDMAGAVYVNQAVGFAIESAGCGLALLVMTRLGCRVTVAYSILQGQLLPCPCPCPCPCRMGQLI